MFRKILLKSGLLAVIGVAMIIIGAVMDVDYYSSIIFAMGVGMTTNSCMQFFRYYHNTRPENVDAYQKKLKEQQIELRDERKNWTQLLVVIPTPIAKIIDE